MGEKAQDVVVGQRTVEQALAHAEKAALDVYAVGSYVLLDGTISARVTGISIRSAGRVFYEVVWWNDRERKEVGGVEEWEIQPNNEKAQTLRVHQVL